MAMLGVVFRALLGKGPPQLRSFFQEAGEREGPTTRSADRHCFQLKTYRTGQHLKVLKRSVLGLVDVFNDLPPAVVERPRTVKDFQALLQALLLTEVKSANGNSWRYLLSASNTSWQRARLRRLRGWDEEVKQRK